MPKKVLIILFLFLFIFITLNLTTDVVLADDIALNINGEIVTDNLDYRIENDSILIPSNILSNYFPISTVWHSDIETLRFDFNDKNLKVRLDDQNMQFGDELLRMPVAPIEDDGKVYVPLVETTEALGLAVNSNPEDNLVEIYEVEDRLKEVNHIVEEHYEAIEIKTSERINYDLNYLEQPARLVFDLKGTILDNGVTSADVNSDLIRATRIAQYNGNTTRAVLDLEGAADYILSEEEKDDYYSYLIKVNPVIEEVDFSDSEVKIDASTPLRNTEVDYSEDSNQAILNIYGASIAEEKDFQLEHDFIKNAHIVQSETEDNNIVQLKLELEEEVQFDTDVQNSSLILRLIQSELQDITYNQDSKRVEFDLTNQIEPELVFLSEGSRLVFDFPDTLNQIEESDFAIDDEYISEIRVSQFSDRNTRVVLDLKEARPYRASWQGDYYLISLLSELEEIKASDSDEQLDINLDLLAEANYEVNKLLDPYRLVVDIMDTSFDRGSLEIDNTSSVIEDIRVGQYSTDSKQTRVVFDFEQEFDYDIVSSLRTDNIQLEVSGFDFDYKTVVVDAGHGGIDPGAIGYSGLEEKEVALDISLKLQELLEEDGINVVMTRDDDSTVDLEERVEITEEAEADAFVSLHTNAHRNIDVMGTETFTNVDPREESQILAEYIQNELVSTLDRPNRGVKEGDKYVLSNVDIPVVLVEPMFLTNPAEERLLRSDSVIEDIAFALYRALNQYFATIDEEEL